MPANVTQIDLFVSMTESYSVLLDANCGEIFRISKNESWDAHLDHLRFPIMYRSSLCGDRCGRKSDAMDASKAGTYRQDRQTDGRTDRPLYPSTSRGVIRVAIYTFDCSEGKEQIAVGRYRHLRRVASVTVTVTVCSLSCVAGCVSCHVLAN